MLEAEPLGEAGDLPADVLGWEGGDELGGIVHQTCHVLTDFPVAQLVAIAGDRGRHVDEDRVDRYVQVLDSLPPLVLFRAPEGLLLADGYHRLAAAVRAGRDVMPVDLRDGTRSDAVWFVVEQASHDRGVTADEARAGIDRWARKPHKGSR